MVGCCPDPAVLCSRCRDDLFACLRGTAACRGERLARQTIARCGRSRPWPATPKAHAIALRWIEDLTRDAGLREMLAVELERWIAITWSPRSRR